MQLLIEQLPHAFGLEKPFYATADSAGADLLAAIHNDIVIPTGYRKLIPTGIKMELPQGFEAQIRPRSGLALHHGITVLNAPGTIDADYRGEISVLLINLGEKPYTVQRGDRIAQMIISQVVQTDFKLGVLDMNTARGEAGYGSTGITMKMTA